MKPVNSMLFSFQIWLCELFGGGVFPLFPLVQLLTPLVPLAPLSLHRSPPIFLIMPSPTLQTRGLFSHSRSSDNLRAIRSGSSTPTSPWKSMFRIGSQSSRKHLSNGIRSSITLNTNFTSTTTSPPNQSLTPPSLMSPSKRYSSNSSNTTTFSNN